MTAEQLEELANGRHPSFMGLDCEEAITAIARRVIAADKRIIMLKSALEPFERQADTFDSNGVEFIPDSFEPAITDHTIGDLRRARAAYREASK